MSTSSGSRVRRLGHDGDVVEPVGPAPRLADADLDLSQRSNPFGRSSWKRSVYPGPPPPPGPPVGSPDGAGDGPRDRPGTTAVGAGRRLSAGFSRRPGSSGSAWPLPRSSGRRRCGPVSLTRRMTLAAGDVVDRAEAVDEGLRCGVGDLVAHGGELTDQVVLGDRLGAADADDAQGVLGERRRPARWPGSSRAARRRRPRARPATGAPAGGAPAASRPRRSAWARTDTTPAVEEPAGRRPAPVPASPRCLDTHPPAATASVTPPSPPTGWRGWPASSIRPARRSWRA